MNGAWQVGITGGMGAGKSLICEVFSVLGIPIYGADEKAKHLMQNDPELRDQLTKLLGAGTYRADGTLNRKHVSDRIFGDAFILESLNALVHPAVHRNALQWHENQTAVPYTLKEAALTFESGGYLQLDFVINVECPQEIRIERIRKRDNLSDAEIQARLYRQWTEEQRRALADFSILNDGKNQIVPQVMAVHRQLVGGRNC